MQETTPFIATAMQCTQAQFDKIKPLLMQMGCSFGITFYSKGTYLSNMVAGTYRMVGFIHKVQACKTYPEWNEQTFINNLGGQPYNDFEQVLAERYKQKEEAPPTYDRAEMATKIMCAMIPVLKTTDTELMADDAVNITDALIERLNQKPQ